MRMLRVNSSAISILGFVQIYGNYNCFGLTPIGVDIVWCLHLQLCNILARSQIMCWPTRSNGTRTMPQISLTISLSWFLMSSRSFHHFIRNTAKFSCTSIASDLFVFPFALFLAAFRRPPHHPSPPRSPNLLLKRLDYTPQHPLKILARGALLARGNLHVNSRNSTVTIENVGPILVIQDLLPVLSTTL